MNVIPLRLGIEYHLMYWHAVKINHIQWGYKSWQYENVGPDFVLAVIILRVSSFLLFLIVWFNCSVFQFSSQIRVSL